MSYIIAVLHALFLARHLLEAFDSFHHLGHHDYLDDDNDDDNDQR